MMTTRKRSIVTIAAVLVAVLAGAQNAGYRLLPEEFTGFVTGLAIGLGLGALFIWAREALSLARRGRSA